MNLFAHVKASVTTRQAAEMYGVKVGRGGMACCPFHDDHHPSMKVDDRYYCFACHETGDVIDFVSRLFDLPPYEAAGKIAADFGLDPTTPMAAAKPRPVRQRAQEGRCAAILIEYERVLKGWQEQFAPNSPDTAWDSRFAAACDALPRVTHLIDCLTSADAVQRRETATRLTADGTLERIANWLEKEAHADGEYPLAG